MLSINELKCFRGESLVLNGISAEINEGETYLIKGSNGSGKTTLLRVLSSLIKNYNGTIFFDDKNIKDDFKFYQTDSKKYTLYKNNKDYTVIATIYPNN